MNKSFKNNFFILVAFVLACACVVAIIYTFGNRNSVSLSNTYSDTTERAESGDEKYDVEPEEQKPPIQKKEFTEFGDFWIEIRKEGLTIKAPIVDGIESDDLKRGVGRHSNTALPNTQEGNIVLSGHRWLPGSNPAYTAFRHIDKLEVGDDVSLFYSGKEYIYRVRESKTVSNEAVEILANTDTPQLTLYTCTPLFTALKRLVYVADFVEVR